MMKININFRNWGRYQREKLKEGMRVKDLDKVQVVEMLMRGTIELWFIDKHGVVCKREIVKNHKDTWSDRSGDSYKLAK